MPRALLLAIVLVLAGIGPAAAHKLKLFATAVGATVEGRVYFVGGGAAVGVPVTLRDSRDEIAGSVETVAPNGTFTLALPYRDTFTLSADAQDGHVATFTLGADRLAETLPEAPAGKSAEMSKVATATVEPSRPDSEVDAAVARQLAPLIDEIGQLRDSIGFRDLLGGIGIILGVFGGWTLLIARRRKP
jgi:nickel transport protein